MSIDSIELLILFHPRIPYNPLAYDIWSLGVCLFIMTNDTLPFMFVDYQEMLQKQLNRDWKFRTRYERNISDDLKQLIRAMLDPDNNNRIKIIFNASFSLRIDSVCP